MRCIVVTGAGGFIGGHLVRELAASGDAVIRAVDKKPIPEWEQVNRGPKIVNFCLDLSFRKNCERMCNGATEVYNLACDMGGIGFIEFNRSNCMRSVLINTHMLQASYEAGVEKYFYSSSACAYPYHAQDQYEVAPLKETDVIPANPERGYGWEKLFSEQMCQEFYFEKGLPTFIGRFHNCYGPCGAWKGGREKAPAAICRKVAEIVQDNLPPEIEVWGNGQATRTYMYIDDCIRGIEKIVHCPELVAVPVNLGSTELVSVDELVDMVVEVANMSSRRKLEVIKKHDLTKPTGVAGRSSDNTLLESKVGWSPKYPLVSGLQTTYDWICHQRMIEKQNGQ